MFPDNICQNIDILVVINVQKNNFGFHSNRKTQGQKHQVNNLYFKYQVCQMILRHLNTFLQFRLLFHEPHCTFFVIVNLICKKNEPANKIQWWIHVQWYNCFMLLNSFHFIPLIHFIPFYFDPAIREAYLWYLFQQTGQKH